MRKAVHHLKKSDPILSAIIEQVGPFRMQYGTAEFSSVAESIVYQQLNGGAAATIFKRFADLSAKTTSGLLDFSKLPEMLDEDVIEHLTRVKGIGVWTAHMFLMFSLRRPDVLPVGDYGIRM